MKHVLDMFCELVSSNTSHTITENSSDSSENNENVNPVKVTSTKMEMAAAMKLFKKHAKLMDPAIYNNDKIASLKREESDNTSIAIKGSPIKISIPNSVLENYQNIIQKCLFLFIQGNNDGSIANMLLDCIKSCHVDCRSNVVDNIIFSGEGASIKGKRNII